MATERLPGSNRFNMKKNRECYLDANLSHPVPFAIVMLMQSHLIVPS